MATAADILIIGGGCMGASIAFHLAQAHAGKVLLCERATFGAGTTGRSSAIVRQHYSLPMLARMAQQSLRTFQRFDEVVGGDVGFRQTGLLIIARSADLDGLRVTAAMHQGLGIDTRILDHAELHTLEPRMALDDLAGACYEPEAGYADPVATIMAYAQRARQLGATLRQQTRVASLLVQGDRVRGVLLDDGATLEAPIVIVAANIWSGALLREVGFELPVHATRHACILLQQPPDFGPQHAIVFDFSNGLYLRPDGADLTIAGTLDESEAQVVNPDHYNALPTHAEAERFATDTARRFPVLAEATLTSGWAGIYDVSPDWQPIIDAVPGIEGLYCAAGFSGHGYKLCPAVGELVRDLVLGQATLETDRDLFRADRFAGGALAPSRYTYGIIG
jgi:glycine/D-amino acid oxidase-like deaminating enzyme